MSSNIIDKYTHLTQRLPSMSRRSRRTPPCPGTRRATTEEFLATLPKFSQTAISNMCVRKCGTRAIPKGSHRLDAYLTRQDMHVLREYGMSIEQIALLKGAVRAKEVTGEEYWCLAYTKREDCQDAIFFVDRDDGDNSAVIK